MMSRRRTPGGQAKPRVLFLDSETWEAFSALAGALRKNGVAVDRVTAVPTTLGSRVLSNLDRVVFSRTRRLPWGGGPSVRSDAVSKAQIEALVPPGTEDIQMQEDLARLAGQNSEVRDTLRRRVGPSIDPAVLYDKRAAADAAAAAGIPVPTRWDEPERTHGDRPFPVVVKAPVGSAGVGVRVACDDADLERARREIAEATGQRPFLQAFHTGLVMSGGFARNGKISVAAEYVGRPASGDPGGPSVAVVAQNDEAVRDLTARFIDHLGYSGFFNIDWVTDPEKGPLLIDFNARAFGSWPALQVLGVDLVGAYLSSLGIGAGPVEAVVEPGRLEGVLRFRCPATNSAADIRAWRRRSLAIVSQRDCFLGRRWAAVSRVAIELAAGQEYARMRRRRIEGRRARGGSRQVLFADSQSWEAFCALAGALRTRGIAVRRVTVKPQGVRERLLQDLERVVYGRTRRLVVPGHRPGEPASIPIDGRRWMESPTVVDIQTQDDLYRSIFRSGGAPPALSRRVGPGVDPAVLFDKRAVARVAEEAGVPTPLAWDMPEADSFPVVVKTPTGYSGEGVRVANTEEELSQAWSDLAAMSGERPFVQAFHGARINSAGVADNGQLPVLVAYRPRPDPGDPTGPSSEVVPVLDEATLERTTRFIGHIGYSGMFNMGWVIDPVRGPLLIDFNARVFGSWAALQSLGADFLGAYLGSLGIGTGARPSTLEPGRSASSLLIPCPPAKSTDDIRAWRRRSLAIVSQRTSLLGKRWAAISRAKIAASASIERVRLSRRG